MIVNCENRLISSGRGVLVFLLPLMFLTACLPLLSTRGELPPLPTRMAVATVPARPTAPLPATSTPPPTETAVPSPTTTPLATATPSPTPDPYTGYTIADLRARSYGGGALAIEETLEQTGAFTRYQISYPSDGLSIYGFMNVPRVVEGPLPVVLVLHGYVNPADYDTLAYTTPHADALAEAGYLVIHPNYRNYPPSDTGDNEFRAGYAIDVLNLIALIRRQGGRAGPLQAADPSDLSLWGHSMGGGVALRVLVVDEGIRAAVLYGSMSGDEYLNYERIFEWTDGRLGQTVLDLPPQDMERIAPIHHLQKITAAVSIHHGAADSQVPAAWSADLCERLRRQGKTVECYTYPGAPHYFGGAADALFRQRVLDFLERY